MHESKTIGSGICGRKKIEERDEGVKTDRKQKRFGGVISRIDGYEECCKLTMYAVAVPFIFSVQIERYPDGKTARKLD